MKKAGGRLDITGAISYRGHLEPLDHVEHKSHSASKADKEIKVVHVVIGTSYFTFLGKVSKSEDGLSCSLEPYS